MVLGVLCGGCVLLSFLLGFDRIEIVKNLVIVGILSIVLMFTLESELVRGNFSYNNSEQFLRFFFSYLFFLVASFLFPLIPEAGWVFLCVFVTFVLLFVPLVPFVSLLFPFVFLELFASLSVLLAFFELLASLSVLLAFFELLASLSVLLAFFELLASLSGLLALRVTLVPSGSETSVVDDIGTSMHTVWALSNQWPELMSGLCALKTNAPAISAAATDAAATNVLRMRARLALLRALLTAILAENEG